MSYAPSSTINGHKTTRMAGSTLGSHVEGVPQQARIVIRYCTGCNWMLRSTYLASELLTTFKNELALSQSEIVLQPFSEPAGIFQVLVNEEKIWDRMDVDENGEKLGFPDTKVLKQLVRDRVLPSKSLGHSDKQT